MKKMIHIMSTCITRTPVVYSYLCIYNIYIWNNFGFLGNYKIFKILNISYVQTSYYSREIRTPIIGFIPIIHFYTVLMVKIEQYYNIVRS